MTLSVCPRMTATNGPVAASHMRAVPSGLAVIRTAVGLKHTGLTAFEWPSIGTLLVPVRASQTRVAPSELVVTSSSPRG